MNWLNELTKIHEDYPEIVTLEDIHTLKEKVEEIKRKVAV